MASPSRSTLFGKIHKVLKKHYKPTPPPNRPLFELLLFSCCLENARFEAAEAAFEDLASRFFDWNEVRVTSANELAEVMHGLPSPHAAAVRLKRSLQGVFETVYAFDLEALKKMNLGQAVQKLQKYDGVSPFCLAYITQSGLGGHAIPLDQGAFDVLVIVGAADESEREKGVVAGLERAIPKTKGFEFGSLLHQLGVELLASPYSPNVHKILLEINPDAKDRLPKRSRKPAPAAAPAVPKATSKQTKKSPAKPAANQAAKSKPTGAKKKAAAAGLGKRKPR